MLVVTSGLAVPFGNLSTSDAVKNGFICVFVLLCNGAIPRIDLHLGNTIKNSLKKIITTYTEYDEDGKIQSQSVTETPYPEDDCDLDCECCDGAEADEDDDDAVYQLTPKGIACLALLRTGLVESIEDPRIDGFWELF